MEKVEKVLVISYYMHCLVTFVLRFVFDKEISSCNDKNFSYYTFSLATTFFILISGAFLPLLKHPKNAYLFYVTLFLFFLNFVFSLVHFLLFFDIVFPIRECPVGAIVTNSFFSFIFLLITVSFLFLVLGVFFLMIFDTFIDPLLEKNYRKPILNLSAIWCGTVIIFLSIFSTISIAKIFHSLQLIFMVFLLLLAKNKPYHQVVNYVHLIVVFGFVSFFVEKYKQGYLTPIGINSLFPSIVILYYLILFMMSGVLFLIEKYKERNGIPPAINASGVV